MTRITGSFPVTAKVDASRRRIVGQIVPFDETGYAAVAGNPTDIVIEAGGLVWDDANGVKLVLDHTGDRPVFAGRARDLVETDTGIIGTFSVIKSTIGDQVLAEATEGLRVGLSIEAELPPQTSTNGVLRITADNPARLHRVALVEIPAFATAQVHEVAASRKAETMTDTVEAAEVPDDQLAEVVTALGDISTSLAALLPPSDPAADAAPEDAAASRPTRVPAVNAAATQVTREPFPYGHPGAEGVSLFRDLMYASRDSAAAQRAQKAQAMMNASRHMQGATLTAANEPTVKSTLIVPNVYDIDRYVEELVNPRVIADNTPGVQIDKPNPIIIPQFSSSAADGGSGEPVIANASEGVNPAQAEIATTSTTVTPALYTGLYDVSREAVDAGAPGTDALIMRTLINSYNESTESAAVTALLAGATAGTNVTTNADLEVEARSAKKAFRVEAAAMNTNLLAPPDAFLLASDVYAAAVAADSATAGVPLYSFLSDRMQVHNDSSSIGYDMSLEVLGRPGLLSHKLTATYFAAVNWGSMIRYESPAQTFSTDLLGPSFVRFALAGYFAQKVLQAKGVRKWLQS